MSYFSPLISMSQLPFQCAEMVFTVSYSDFKDSSSEWQQLMQSLLWYMHQNLFFLESLFGFISTGFHLSFYHLVIQHRKTVLRLFPDSFSLYYSDLVFNCKFFHFNSFVATVINTLNNTIPRTYSLGILLVTLPNTFLYDFYSF